LIASLFAEDLVLPRKDARAKHIVQAIGSSSLQKAKDFMAKHIPQTSPTLYSSYEQVYADPEVDVVYIGTPHAFHKKNCLDAIAAGKNVLCEKAFTLNAPDAEEVIAAAKANGVFLMEAMWTRFTPLMQTLQKMLHEEKVIGNVRRTFCDFGLDLDITSLPPESRYKDPALGAGSLLDIGIYSLTWGLVSLDPGVGAKSEMPKVLAQ
jgi:predicted dehydrogenase